MKSIIGSMVAVAGLMVAGSAMAEEMPAMAKKLNCTACHAIDRKVVGPSWRDIAIKYRGVGKFTYSGKDYPLVEGLVVKISKGGFGNWGTMPMPPNDTTGAKQAEITELVKFALGLPAK